MNLEQDANSCGTEERGALEINFDRVVATAELFGDRVLQFAGTFGIEPAGDDQLNAAAVLSPLDRHIHPPIPQPQAACRFAAV